jgi:guanosine-3',5'-bis(diphosphate) 3'-pyrophosphohydrolase
MTAPSGLALVLAAADFAARRHRDQRRKGTPGEPFINHPLRVANILAAEHGVDDPIVVAAAILHDILEDTNTTQAELEARFGAEVAGVVAEVSDDPTLDNAHQKQAQVVGAPGLSERARLLRLADKIANVHDLVHRPPDWHLARKRFYLQWARLVVDPIRGTHPALEARFDAECEAAKRALA